MTVTPPRAAAVALLGLAALPLSIAFVDRPLAGLAHAHLQGIAAFPLLTHIVDPLPPLASICLLAMAAAAAGGWRPGPLARTLLTAALAVMAAVVLKEQAKFLFGRTWPETWVDGNPSYFRDGAYGFAPLHGGKGWTAFPSGHIAVMAAPAAAVWNNLPRLRWICVIFTLAVAVGLLGADYHWLSDIIAGALLGAAAGAGTARLTAPGPARA